MKTIVIIISALTTFAIVTGVTLGAVLVALEGRPLSKTALWISLLNGIVAAGKDVRATMMLPPLSNGNYQAITQLMKIRTGDTDRFTKPPEPQTPKQNQ